MSEWSPLVGDICSGSVGGFAVGYFVKKVSKIILFILGGYLLSLQFLAGRKLITIHYDIFLSAGSSLLQKVSSIAPSFAPFGLSFVGGIALGLKKE